jgi:hypothetical protein
MDYARGAQFSASVFLNIMVGVEGRFYIENSIFGYIAISGQLVT